MPLILLMRGVSCRLLLIFENPFATLVRQNNNSTTTNQLHANQVKLPETYQLAHALLLVCQHQPRIGV